MGKCVGFHGNVDDFIVLWQYLVFIFKFVNNKFNQLDLNTFNIEIDVNIFFVFKNNQHILNINFTILYFCSKLPKEQILKQY